MSQERPNNQKKELSRVSNSVIQHEINQHKVDIDKSVFKKDPLEYKELKKERKAHRKYMRQNDSLHMEGRDQIIRAFMGSKTPNWGNLVFIA